MLELLAFIISPALILVSSLESLPLRILPSIITLLIVESLLLSANPDELLSRKLQQIFQLVNFYILNPLWFT